jgi:hypothetical protein
MGAGRVGAERHGGVGVNSREHLAADLDRLVKRSRWVGYFAWTVAVIVMVYGTPIVYEFLVGHGIPGEVAWLLSLAADAALIVGLIATPVLAELDEPAGWVGTLRWVAGFITWGLQTAGSWTATGGPDMVGVLSHTAGPVLLFFAVEAASSFQRKVAAKLTEKTRQLASAEQKDADVRAHRAEVDAKLRSTAAELTAARAENQSLTERLTAATNNTDAVKAEIDRTVERLEAEIGALRKQITDQAEKHTADKAEALRAQKERLTKDRAEKGTVSLSAYRKDRTAKTSPQPTNRPAMSDEEAVQAMFDKHSDPEHTWSQNSVRTLTGAGFGRIPNLITAWRERALREAGGDVAVNQ